MIPEVDLYPYIDKHKDVNIKAMMDDPSGLQFLDA